MAIALGARFGPYEVTGTLGALWGAIYLVRGSAVAPIVSHSLFNSVQLFQVFLR